MKNIYFLLILPLFFSCDQPKEKIPEKSKLQIRRERNESIVNALCLKYGAIPIDSLFRKKYTFQRQSLIEENIFTLHDFSINDIAKQDSNYKLFISLYRYSENNNLELICTPDNLELLSEDSAINKGRATSNAFIIIKLNTISRISFKVSSESSEDEEGSSYLSLGDINGMIAHGNIITLIAIQSSMR